MNKREFLDRINKIGISFEQFNRESTERANEENKTFATELEENSMNTQY